MRTEVWTPVAADASARRYFKGEGAGGPVLRAEYGEDRDGLNRYVFLTRLFQSRGIRVPALYEARPEEGVCIVEWIEGEPLSRGRWNPEWESRLVDLALSVAAVPPWEGEPDLLALDADRLRFELRFFALHFLEGLLNRPRDPALAAALDGLAEEVASFPRALAHRDFHSENVLASRSGEWVLIDFQDALLAPRCYDAASLACDAYRHPDPAIGRRIEAAWIERTGHPSEEFRRTELQRCLKALGTFGYQVTRRRKVRYLLPARRTAARADHLLRSAPAPLPGLAEALQEAARI
ncbi:MAG: phosphotransferase [Acidobacteriota bacterium]